MNMKKSRGIGRRKEDFIVRKENSRFQKLSEIGKIITAEIDLKVLFPLVMDQTNAIMNSERSTVFLYDSDTDELWSLVATGMEETEIRIPANSGVAGWVFQNRQPQNIKDPYNDSRFNIGVDCRTGFKTDNILCVPLINNRGNCTGVLQVLNHRTRDFTESDEAFLIAISDYAAIALENAKLYDDVQQYSKRLQEQVIINESLTKVKDQLAKFVPRTVANLAESNPNLLSEGKIPMDVTILFVDICKFSSITANYNQRMVNHMVENHFSKYIRCIQKRKGEINETAGDGFMVLFKSDTLEKHVREAVLTALEISAANQQINNEFNYPWGNVYLHIGISTGEGHVGTTRMMSLIRDRMTYTASGLVTILASRIGSISEKSKVYVCPETQKRLNEYFECEFVDNFHLKNVSDDKIPVYHVKNYALPDEETDVQECF